MPKKKEHLDWLGQLFLCPIKMHLTDIAVSGLPEGKITIMFKVGGQNSREGWKKCHFYHEKVFVGLGKLDWA